FLFHGRKTSRQPLDKYPDEASFSRPPSARELVMKNTALLVAICCFTTAASAVQIYEPFNYPPGSLVAGTNGWVLAAGTSPKVATNGLATPGLQPAAEGYAAVFGNGPMELRRGMK